MDERANESNDVNCKRSYKSFNDFGNGIQDTPLHYTLNRAQTFQRLPTLSLSLSRSSAWFCDALHPNNTNRHFSLRLPWIQFNDSQLLFSRPFLPNAPCTHIQNNNNSKLKEML